MIVREVPTGIIDVAMYIFGAGVFVALIVYPAVMLFAGEEKWAKSFDKAFLPITFAVCALTMIGTFMARDILSHQRPADESDYESVGSYAATVTRVYPQVVEVDTDFGVSLPVPVSMMPEGAAEVGSAVTIDVSTLSSRPGVAVQRPSGGVSPIDSGGPVFVSGDTCESSGVLSCAEAFGDTEKSDGLDAFLVERYYGVTAVRANG